MSEENKKFSFKDLSTKDIWKVVGIGVDVIVTILLLILSIIMIAKIKDVDLLKNSTGFWGMVYYLMKNPYVFLGAVVVPLFILLVLNITLTVYYYQKLAQKEKDEADKAKAKAGTPDLNNLTPEQKEALKRELMKELSAKDEEKK